MCGIAAAFSHKAEVEALDLEKIRHRGPDGQGSWHSEDGRVWLGNTRLAILDLTPTGAQPMIDPLTGNVIVLNGEIYNHLEVRKELAAYDPAWKGRSDTETLLIAYRHWKESMLSHLKGMFAFILYDATEHSLFVARDRLGIKPLYYKQQDGTFLFASESRLLKDSQESIPSPEAVSAYLQWGASPEEHLLPSSIKMFPTGHSMKINQHGIFSLRRYWPPLDLSRSPFERPLNGSAPQTVRRLLEKAVEEHLLSDVPVAAFLSGGIDSSVVTALAAQRISSELSTFSVGFREKSFDEADIAEIVAKRWNTDHHRIEVGEEEVIALVKEAVQKMDMPSVDAINTYVVSKKVSEQGIKVALSGLGGDELFGGYPSFTDVPKLKLVAIIPERWRKSWARFGALGQRLADLPSKEDASILANWRRRFWTDEMLRSAGLPVVPIELPPTPWLSDDFSKISWAELSGYMRHMLLRDSDQMSMAVSLELRVPFLDHELVEHVLCLPAEEKTKWGRPKGLLIEACKDLLPVEVYQRKKMGFSLPMDLWKRGPLSGFVRDGLGFAVQHSVFSEKLAQSYLAEFEKGKTHWTRLWSIVVLGWYLSRFSAISMAEQ